MFRHIVLFTFADDAPEGLVPRLIDALDELPDKIPALKSVRVGVDAGVWEGNHDLALVADFDSQADWQTYVDHPAHVQVATELIRPYITARGAVQHEW